MQVPTNSVQTPMEQSGSDPSCGKDPSCIHFPPRLPSLESYPSVRRLSKLSSAKEVLNTMKQMQEITQWPFCSELIQLPTDTKDQRFAEHRDNSASKDQQDNFSGYKAETKSACGAHAMKVEDRPCAESFGATQAGHGNSMQRPERVEVHEMVTSPKRQKAKKPPQFSAKVAGTSEKKKSSEKKDNSTSLDGQSVRRQTKTVLNSKTPKTGSCKKAQSLRSSKSNAKAAFAPLTPWITI